MSELTADKTPKILCVDDEKSILMAIRRLFRGKGYEVKVSERAKEALEWIAEGEVFDVIVSDMRMPEMDGAEFLSAVAEFAPETMRILLTGYSDQESTVKAINQGKIYRYLNKPWDNAEFLAAIEQALKQKAIEDERRLKEKKLSIVSKNLHSKAKSLQEQVVTANQELEQTASFLDMAQETLQKNFDTTLKVFSNLVNMRVGQSHASSQRIVDFACGFALSKGIKKNQVKDLEIAATLYQLGKVGFSDRLLSLNEDNMSEEELKQYQAFPVITEQVLMPLDAMQPAAKIIRHQNEHYDGSGFPDKLVAEDIPLPSRLLKIIIDYVYLRDVQRLSSDSIFETMQSESGKSLDPNILKHFTAYIRDHDQGDLGDRSTGKIYSKCVDDLRVGMLITEDVMNMSGILLLSKETELSSSMISRLYEYEKTTGEKVSVNVMLGIENTE